VADASFHVHISLGRMVACRIHAFSFVVAFVLTVGAADSVRL
jgi:hypothetical protein